MGVQPMKLEENFSQKKALCRKCPYKSGLVETVTNPCPQCKMNGHRSYEWFQKQLSKECSDSFNGNRYDE